MKYKPVKLVWADAHSDSSGWAGVKEHSEEGEYLVHSIGFLITEEDGGKPGHVTICQSHTPDDDIDHVLYIPHAMVRQINVIEPQQTEALDYGHGRYQT